jgi:hypothetical protein
VTTKGATKKNGAAMMKKSFRNHNVIHKKPLQHERHSRSHRKSFETSCDGQGEGAPMPQERRYQGLPMALLRSLGLKPIT